MVRPALGDTSIMSTDENTVENIDWQSQLRDDEVGRDGNTEFVFIKGLRRLAKLKGIQWEDHTISPAIVLHRPDNGAEYPFVQVKYMVQFNDGTRFSDVADAHTYNVQGMFSAYPTAMAATRAEARALRKALGINLVAKEELGADAEGIAQQKNEITSAQERVIKNLMKTRKIKDESEVIGKVCSRENIFSVKDLTFQEAQSAIQMMNKVKVKD
jgi:hypothetical protein